MGIEPTGTREIATARTVFKSADIQSSATLYKTLQ
jgi:hypothetical protein